MNDTVTSLAIPTVALGSAVVGGIFFAFSTFVMKAFSRLDPEQGIAAMQEINVTVLNPWFFTVFFGTGLGSLYLVVFAATNWNGATEVNLAIGSLLYIVGTILVTIVFNVPLNTALAEADASSPEGQSLWRQYLRRWTFWNHVRTSAAIASATLLFFVR